MRRWVTAVVMSLTLTACGGSTPSDSAPTPTTTPAPTEEPTEEPAATDAPPPSATAAPDAPEPEAEPEPEPESGSSLAETPSTAEPASEPELLWPDDGCSADNSPTPASVAEGPAPAVELRPESVDSPLPDLAIRRINCKGGWENLRNELPADRPLLVWFWAPH